MRVRERGGALSERERERERERKREREKERERQTERGRVILNHVHHTSCIGLTLRRGAGILGNALGDFFGVTEVSQRGNTAEGRIGWEQYTERRVEEVRYMFSAAPVYIIIT